MSVPRPRNLIDASLTEEIALDPRDVFLAPWRSPTPLPDPDGVANAFPERIRHLLAIPFDPQAILDFLQDVRPCLDLLRVRIGHRLLEHPNSLHAILLAAWFDRPEPLAVRIALWPDGFFASEPASALGHLVALGMASGDRYLYEVRRLGLRPGEPWQLRGWLAHTGCTALGEIATAVEAVADRKKARELVQVLTVVRDPRVAGVMLRLSRRAFGGPARAWLRLCPGNAIAGLVPLAAQADPLASQALSWLECASESGYEPLVRSRLDELAEPDRERLTAALFGRRRSVPVLDRRTTPPWLRRALRRQGKASPWPSWLRPETLPPVVLEGRQLDARQVDSLLRKLRTAKLRRPFPLAAALRNHSAPGSLDAFVWTLFDRWDSAGQPARGRWTLTALAWLGEEESALRLGPLLHAWPKQGKLALARHALDCLREMELPAASFQIITRSRNRSSTGLRLHASKLLTDLAFEQHLEPARLAERVVPTFGFDEKGIRVFDYGSRRFEVVLDDSLRPVVRSQTGACLSRLPAPRAGESGLANESWLAWQELLERLPSAARLCGQLLEEALVCSATWSCAEWEGLFLCHPLWSTLGRLLLWEAEGSHRIRYFRTEDRQPIDAGGEPISLPPDCRIRLAHPVRMPEAELRRWSGVFADHELLPPFPQFGRPIHHLPTKQKGGTEFLRLRGIPLPARTLLGVLRRRGWVRAYRGDSEGPTTFHYREFPALGLIAVLVYAPGIPRGPLSGDRIQKMSHCFVQPGTVRDNYFAYDPAKALLLGRLDPVLTSELLTDLEALAG